MYLWSIVERGSISLLSTACIWIKNCMFDFRIKLWKVRLNTSADIWRFSAAFTFMPHVTLNIFTVHFIYSEVVSTCFIIFIKIFSATDSSFSAFLQLCHPFWMLFKGPNYTYTLLALNKHMGPTCIFRDVLAPNITHTLQTLLTVFCCFIQYSLISDRSFWHHWIELNREL